MENKLRQKNLNNILDLKSNFSKNGYLVIKKNFENNLTNKIIKEIDDADGTIKYFDGKGIIRRIEKIYDKGKELKNLNQKILVLLKSILDEEFIIFKDKFNAKPPGGEGFFAHYDGIFHFKDENNNTKNGWYEYGDVFINALVALDECNKENGALELAKEHHGNFNDLIENTKQNGTPELLKEIEVKTKFNLINLDVGDIVIFSNKCPHRSQKNYSTKNRRILYYTYSLSKNGSKYDKYFEDKQKSKNSFKALEKK